MSQTLGQQTKVVEALVLGDNSQDGSRGIDLRDIKALPKRQLYEETCEKMREIPQLKKVCDKLQYNL